MRFLWYFRISGYLLVASGFFALLVTEDYGVLAGLLFALLLFTGWQIDSGKWIIPIAPFWWTLATIAALVFSVADAVFFRRLQAVALVNFLIFLQATKILHPKQRRDYVTIYIISFVQLLASTIMTYSVLFAVSCVLFAMSATWAFITLYLKTEIETHVLPTRRADPEEAEAVEERLAREQEAFNVPAVNTLLNNTFFIGTFGITLLTFGLALVIFLIMPRVREGFFFQYGAELSQRVSGFSEEVDLDTFGTIRMNYQPVMRVTLPENVDPNALSKRLYWKGLSFNYYDGVRWRSDPQSRKHIRVQSRYEKFYWLQRQKSVDDLLAQHIELNSVNFEVLFGADRMQAVEGKFLSLQHDRITGNTNVIYDPYHITYTVYSNVSLPTEDALRDDMTEYPEHISRFYLQVPEISDRITDLAQQIVVQQETVYDKVLAVQSFLMQNYAYSLDVQRSGDIPPLEDFLFVNQAGHCEYYATSMAILLRLVGVPTRIVNGFAQGRWNEFGHFFTVRQSDAHSWVEVYFPSYGWVQFDPTPGAAFGETYQEFLERESVIARLYRYSENLRVRWNRYIVDYSREDQANALVNAFIATRNARRSLRAWVSQQQYRVKHLKELFSWTNIGRVCGILMALMLTFYGLKRILRHWRIRLPIWRWRKRAAGRQIVKFYHQMRRILARKGISRETSLTPGEFARYVAQEYAYYGPDVREITDAYYAVRYGALELTQEQLDRIEGMLNMMKKREQ
jgi:transglutaminase-like putative cysteine protease